MSCEKCINSEGLIFNGIEDTRTNKNLLKLALFIELALVIVGIAAACGAFPGGTTLGGVTIGLGAAAALANLATGANNCNQRKFSLIQLVLFLGAMVTLGALGINGTLNTAQVGFGILGTLGAAYLLEMALCRKLKVKNLVNMHPLGHAPPLAATLTHYPSRSRRTH